MSSNRLRSSNIRKEPSNRLDSPIVNSEVDIKVGGRKGLERAYLGFILDCSGGRFMWRWVCFAFWGGKFWGWVDLRYGYGFGVWCEIWVVSVRMRGVFTEFGLRDKCRGRLSIINEPIVNHIRLKVALSGNFYDCMIDKVFY